METIMSFGRLLIILEGADGSGKTTLAKELARRYGYQYTRQPNDKGVLGHLRDIVKTADPDSLDELSRQLLHACSHIYDLVGFTKSRDSYVMDRSPHSTVAYSKALSLNESQIDLLRFVNYGTYKETIPHLFDGVLYIYVTSDGNFREIDNSHYELNCSQVNIRKAYDDIFTDLAAGKDMFHPRQINIKVTNIVGEYENTLNILSKEITNYNNSIQ